MDLDFLIKIDELVFSCLTIWQLEASRCDQNDVRGCENIFHYRKLHSENFIFSTISDLLLPPMLIGVRGIMLIGVTGISS